MITQTRTITTTQTYNVAEVSDFTNFLEKRGLLYKYFINCFNTPQLELLKDRTGRQTPFKSGCKEPLVDFMKFLRNNSSLNKWYSGLISESFIWAKDIISGPKATLEWDRASTEWDKWLEDNRVEDFIISSPKIISSAEDLFETKLKVTPGQSTKVQKKLFDLGFRWSGGGKTVQYTSSPYLFIWPDYTLAYSDDTRTFEDREYTEISVQDILDI